MATGNVKSPKATMADTTNGASGISQSGFVVYDPNTSTVRLYMYARSDSNIGTSDALAYVPEGYRPSQNYALYGVMVTSSNVTAAYYGQVGTDGKIIQRLGSTVRDVFLTGEWKV